MKRFAAPAAVFVLIACALNPRAPTDALLPAQPVDSALAGATFDSAWSRIGNSYYDTAMRGIDWNALRSELRPRALAASTLQELRRVLVEMLGRLGESHFAIIPAERTPALERGEANGVADVGMELRLIEGRLLVSRIDTPGGAWDAGVRPGWELRRVDGIRLDSLIGAAALTLEGSPTLLPFQAVRRAEVLLAGEAGSAVAAELADGTGRLRAVRITRAPPRGYPVSFGLLPTIVSRVEHQRVRTDGGCVGVVRFNAWMAPIAVAIDSAIVAHSACDGLVLDLRGNPGGLAAMTMGVAGHFLTTPDSLGTLRLRGATLHLVANPRYTRAGDSLLPPRRGRLAILIDELSASTTEIFAAAMQELGRARVFGSPSPGFALPAQTVRLPNGDVLMHVIADFLLPRGGRVEAIGVRPDVQTVPSRADLLAGRDPVLDSAVEWAGARHNGQ